MPTEEASQESGEEDVGELLQLERIRQGLDEKQVADRLHITMHYVKAIESNSFEKLPGAVFAKGYVKSYAVLLELDEGRVLGLYEKFTNRLNEESEESLRSKSRRRMDKNKIWIIASVLVFVFGFAALWMFSGLAPDEESSEETIAAAQITSDDAGAVAPSAEVESGDMTSSTATTDSETVNNSAAEPVVVAASSQTERLEQFEEVNSAEFFALFTNAPAVPSGANSVFDTAAENSPVVVVDSVPNSSSESNEGAESQLIEVVSEGSDVLEVSFSGESWIEVTDAAENQIYRDIRGAGDVLEITGAAPFNILLGDAPFAKVSINGSAIDVSDNIRIDNSARIQVGP